MTWFAFCAVFDIGTYLIHKLPTINVCNVEYIQV